MVGFLVQVYQIHRMQSQCTAPPAPTQLSCTAQNFSPKYTLPISVAQIPRFPCASGLINHSKIVANLAKTSLSSAAGRVSTLRPPRSTLSSTWG